MRLDDTGRVADLCDQLGYPCSVVEVSRRFESISQDENHAFYIAETAREGVVGWIHLYACNLMVDDSRVEIWGLVIDERHRGGGLGRLLMEYAEDWARSKGCRSVYLRSNIIRDGAHRFYENLGYDRVKTQHVFRKAL
jgi:GNAT superfamily N-acetyltransferase